MKNHFGLFHILFVVLFYLCTCLPAMSQKTGVYQQTEVPDTIYSYTHSPVRAAMYSAVLPGMGQVYNTKYWKVPIIYAGFGVITYFVLDFDYRYKLFRSAYADLLKGVINEEFQKEYSYFNFESSLAQQNLERNMNRFRRFRDLNIIIGAGLYLLNILDANVDGHFRNYDISKDLSLKIKPDIINKSWSDKTIFGLTCQLRF